ncbi:hypothetical protein FOA52_004212 [Chlamydomonas sp. UWO 241]|nr:hypothetical protein FOA52_004212 [Chlamydomonas sp. UWO 241]
MSIALTASPVFDVCSRQRLAASRGSSNVSSAALCTSIARSWLSDTTTTFLPAVMSSRHEGQCKRGQGRQHCSFRYTICSSSCNS